MLGASWVSCQSDLARPWRGARHASFPARMRGDAQPAAESLWRGPGSMTAERPGGPETIGGQRRVPERRRRHEAPLRPRSNLKSTSSSQLGLLRPSTRAPQAGDLTFTATKPRSERHRHSRPGRLSTARARRQRREVKDQRLAAEVPPVSWEGMPGAATRPRTRRALGPAPSPRAALSAEISDAFSCLT